MKNARPKYSEMICRGLLIQAKRLFRLAAPYRTPPSYGGSTAQAVWQCWPRSAAREQVGGRAHEPKRICFVWRGGDAAYRNGGADGFSRHAFRRRCWQFEVL